MRQVDTDSSSLEFDDGVARYRRCNDLVRGVARRDRPRGRDTRRREDRREDRRERRFLVERVCILQ